MTEKNSKTKKNYIKWFKKIEKIYRQWDYSFTMDSCFWGIYENLLWYKEVIWRIETMQKLFIDIWIIWNRVADSKLKFNSC